MNRLWFAYRNDERFLRLLCHSTKSTEWWTFSSALQAEAKINEYFVSKRKLNPGIFKLFAQTASGVMKSSKVTATGFISIKRRSGCLDKCLAWRRKWSCFNFVYTDSNALTTIAFDGACATSSKPIFFRLSTNTITLDEFLNLFWHKCEYFVVNKNYWQMKRNKLSGIKFTFSLKKPQRFESPCLFISFNCQLKIEPSAKTFFRFFVTWNSTFNIHYCDR